MKKIITACLAVALFFIVAPSTFAATDIKGHWAESNIRTLIQKNIVSGYEDGTFRPNHDITRAEFSTLMIRMLEQIDVQPQVTETDGVELSDLEPTAWYYNEVMQAVKLGIVNGYDDGKFHANNKITRQEMAAMIIRTLNINGIPSAPAQLTFTDANKIANWAKEDVQRVVFLGIMGGQPGNRFAPEAKSTRAEVATVLVRMMNKFTHEPTLTYTHYNITLDQMIDTQMKTQPTPPQTDKYGDQVGYLSGEYIINVHVGEDGKTYGYIHATVLNVRSGPGTEFEKIGQYNSNLENPTKVQLRKEVKNDKGEVWYEIYYGRWANAKREDVAYYVNPNNFQAGSKEYFQFLILSKRAGITADELNNKILKGKGILEGKGQAFIDASIKHNINEIYLVAHALLETGQGFSNLAQGIEVEYIVERDAKGNPIVDENGQVKKKQVEKKKVYNFFGIGAIDQCPNECGSERAYQEGWFTPEAAIVGGAKFISERYINHPTYKQDTLYKMRWNPDQPGVHQYATDIGWAVKQVNRMYEMYQLLDNYSLYFDVPVYK